MANESNMNDLKRCTKHDKNLPDRLHEIDRRVIVSRLGELSDVLPASAKPQQTRESRRARQSASNCSLNDFTENFITARKKNKHSHQIVTNHLVAMLQLNKILSIRLTISKIC